MASEWRHRWERGDTRCTVPDERDPRDICGCTTPTPDPASPCAVCGMSILQNGHDLSHRHVATRCLTCGHPIEEARP